MPKVVGIPRGLFYYQYYPLWKAFFEELGTELAVSPETNRTILEAGVASCVGEACLPVKTYFGHVLSLKDKADLLFIPRYTSVHRGEYICPKFGGLPDMARASLHHLPECLSPEVNLHDRANGGLKAALEAGKTLGAGRRRSASAYDAALRVYRDQRAQSVTVRAATNRPEADRGEDGKLRILLLGHCYTLGDRFLNMDAARKLEALGVETLTLNSFDGRELRQAAGPLEKPLFWTFGTQALGCAYLLMRKHCVDGVLHLSCFGCGVDSFVGYLFERRVRRAGIPFATVTLDEHTGEAGLQTRLEAFTDTLLSRRAGA